MPRTVVVLVAALTALAAACAPEPPAPPPPVTVEVTATPALFPPFDPSITDYVARCGDGAPVTVSVGVPDGTWATVDGQPLATGRFTTTVTRQAGQAFTILYLAPPGEPWVTYFVRCLPIDFPELTASRSAPTTPEFFVTNPLRFDQGYPPRTRPVILDRNGTPVWWGAVTDASYYTTVLDDGLLATAVLPGVDVMGLDGALQASVPAAVGENDPHDVLRLANGNFVMVSNVRVDDVDLTDIGLPPDAEHPNGHPVWNHVVQEVTPAGQLVWSWDVMANIPVTEVPPRWRANLLDPGNPAQPNPVFGYDLYHWNSIEDAGDGTFVLSFRHLDAVYEIDSQGGVVWKLGGGDANPPATGTHLTVAGDPTFAQFGPAFGGQHDARIVPGGSATVYDLTVYDNRTVVGGASNGAPRGVRYTIDEGAGTATFVSEVTDPLAPISFCCGSARLVAPGEWVIAFGGTNLAGTHILGSRTMTVQWEPGWAFYRFEPIESPAVTIEALRAGMDAQYAAGGTTTLDVPERPPLRNLP